MGRPCNDLARVRHIIVSHRILTASGCWLWTGGKGRYGRIRINNWYPGAHVASFLAFGGRLTKTKPWVLHSCDTPRCINPEHLHSGNGHLNTLESVKRKRHHQARKRTCAHGHMLTDAIVIKVRYGRVRRRCRECNRINCRKFWRMRNG